MAQTMYAVMKKKKKMLSCINDTQNVLRQWKNENNVSIHGFGKIWIIHEMYNPAHPTLKQLIIVVLKQIHEGSCKVHHIKKTSLRKLYLR